MKETIAKINKTKSWFFEQNKEKRMKRIEDSLRDFWDNIKCTNIRIDKGPRRRRREQERN